MAYYKAVFLLALLVAVAVIDAATETENTNTNNNADYYKNKGRRPYPRGGRGHYPPSTKTNEDDGDDTDWYKKGGKYGHGGKGGGHGHGGKGGKYPPAGN